MCCYLDVSFLIVFKWCKQCILLSFWTLGVRRLIERTLFDRGLHECRKMVKFYKLTNTHNTRMLEYCGTFLRSVFEEHFMIYNIISVVSIESIDYQNVLDTFRVKSVTRSIESIILLFLPQSFVPSQHLFVYKFQSTIFICLLLLL